MTYGLLILVALLGLALGWVALQFLVVARKPVGHRRVAQFVTRSGVVLTHENSRFVLDSLARSVRWRLAGLMVGGSVATSLVIQRAFLTGGVTVGTEGIVVLAVGFLAGAIVGEVRNAVHRGDGPQRAELVRRQESGYVGAWAKAIPAASALLSLVLAALALVGGSDGALVAAFVCGAVVPFLVSRWATRVILERPRPASAADDVSIRLADDGLRSRGLHAIGGPVVLVSTWSALSLLGDALVPHVSEPGLMLVALAAGLVATARWAWLLATRPFAVEAAEPAPRAVPPMAKRAE